MNLELDPFDEHSPLWRAGYEEGVKRALQTTSVIPTGEDVGYNISTIRLLRSAIQDLPPKTEVLDPFGVPLRGDICRQLLIRQKPVCLWPTPPPTQPRRTFLMPFDFNFGDDGPSIRSAVFQALGFASTCWDSMSHTGVFKSNDVSQAGDKLVEFINQWQSDVIDAYLKKQRDQYPQHRPSWHTLDKVLDDFRLHCYTGDNRLTTPIDPGDNRG